MDFRFRNRKYLSQKTEKAWKSNGRIASNFDSDNDKSNKNKGIWEDEKKIDVANKI